MAQNNIDPIKYYVALDLGSESMAAYYEDTMTGEGGMISLQAYGNDLLAAGSPPELLPDGDGPSPRLRTRIGLEDRRQQQPLIDAHAKLDFVDSQGGRQSDYDKSLFSYFYLPDQVFGRTILPNPKIPFQEGGAKIIPPVADENGREVRHLPESLLSHLTVQVLRNFVLRSPELRKARPEEVHLVLTVPNVYSLVHVKSLMDFVRQHVTVGKLDYLYESDAVAYLFLSDSRAGASEEVEAFQQAILNRDKKDLLRMATIDIGRGTTDLSLVQIESPVGDAGQRRHYVLARTGKSDGGNRLSYLFAEYYNDIVRQVFAEHEISVPFDFLESPGSVGSAQAPALVALEKLIEGVKKGIDDDYRVTLSHKDQSALVDAVVERLLLGVDATWNGEDARAVQGLPRLRDDLKKALLLPRRLPRGFRDWLFSIGGVQAMFRILQSGGAVARRLRLSALTAAIERYVEHNVVQLIDQLEEMAQSRESPPNRASAPKKVFDRRCTFVVIAGQGSQFAPIAVSLQDHLGRHNLPKGNIHFLQKSDAKEACCRGAVQFIRAHVILANEEELHGVYGFLNAAPTNPEDRFKPAAMAQIRSGGECTITFRAVSEFWFVFLPRLGATDGRPPRRDDGTTAVIRSFEGSEFHLKYDAKDLSIHVNGEPVGIIPTFGNINESIYPKIWPEVLRPSRNVQP